MESTQNFFSFSNLYGYKIISARNKFNIIYIVRNVISKESIANIIRYLTQVGKGSLPNYRKIEANCPNFHRIVMGDERSYVKGYFHQFVFFPWNQDVFNLFELTKEVYYLKNLLSNLSKNSFLSFQPENSCIARLSFQFYPRGIGKLNMHYDPVNYHQLTVPIMIMSKKGVDFNSGGVYVKKANGENIFLDDITDIGDVIYFNANTPHGVEVIDPNEPADWTSFKGRWMLLFAVNKLFNNETIQNSVDLQST